MSKFEASLESFFGQHNVLPNEEKRLPLPPIQNKCVECQPALVLALCAGPAVLNPKLLGQKGLFVLRMIRLVDVREELAAGALIIESNRTKSNRNNTGSNPPNRIESNQIESDRGDSKKLEASQ